MTSALMGVIEKLRNGERLSDQATDELERLLHVLQEEGWSGFITADQAVRAIAEGRKAGIGVP